MAEKSGPRLPVFRPRSRGLEQMLGALEAQVMQAVWDTTEAVSVDEVRRTLSRHGKTAAYTTVMTTLARLHAKGLLAREMRGKAYFYTARVTERELGSTMSRQVIDGLMTTLAEPAMSYFVDALGRSDPDKLDLLSELIERKRKAQRGAE